MNGIIINWKIISKGIKRGNRCSNDRPPSKEEIQKLLKYPDRRIKPIVLVMVSSGIRVGSWGYLKWGDITPITKNGSVVAAKIKVLNTKTNKYYFSFVTYEAYGAVKEWGFEGSGDGQLNYPFGIVVASSGNVYVADTANNRIQVFAPDLTILSDNGKDNVENNNATFAIPNNTTTNKNMISSQPPTSSPQAEIAGSNNENIASFNMTNNTHSIGENMTSIIPNLSSNESKQSNPQTPAGIVAQV